MSNYDSELTDDVEELLEKVVLEEATALVWKTFEAALRKLDPESRTLIEDHLNGVSADKLGAVTQIPKKEIENWLKQVKRELKQNIRKDFVVKQ